MFGMSLPEIIVILVVAVLVLGPDKLPEALVKFAKFFKYFKAQVNSAKSNFEQEVRIAELKADANKLKDSITDAGSQIRKKLTFEELDELKKTASDFSNDVKNSLNFKTPTTASVAPNSAEFANVSKAPNSAIGKLNSDDLLADESENSSTEKKVQEEAQEKAQEKAERESAQAEAKKKKEKAEKASAAKSTPEARAKHQERFETKRQAKLDELNRPINVYKEKKAIEKENQQKKETGEAWKKQNQAGFDKDYADREKRIEINRAYGLSGQDIDDYIRDPNLFEIDNERLAEIDAHNAKNEGKQIYTIPMKRKTVKKVEPDGSVETRTVLQPSSIHSGWQKLQLLRLNGRW